MRWTNYHGHSKYCDGHGEIEDYILKAIELNMASIGISSHAPVPFPSTWNMPSAKLENYFQDIEQLKNKYENQINIYRSLEVDYVPNLISPTHPSITDLDLDYTIGSIHYVSGFKDGTPWDLDGPFELITQGLETIFHSDAKVAVKHYFNLQNEMLENHTPDILGHMDKIKMHNLKFSLFDESEDWYVDQVKQTLILAKEKGTIVEINTKTFNNPGYFCPAKEHFKFIKQNNIPITINSDAHMPKFLILGFEEVADLLTYAGINQVWEFVNGNWCPVELVKQGLII